MLFRVRIGNSAGFTYIVRTSLQTRRRFRLMAAAITRSAATDVFYPARKIEDRIMHKICLFFFAIISISFSQDSLILFFPCKDGCASRTAFSGDRKEIIVDEETKTVGWIACKKPLIDVTRIKSAMLMLHIQSVKKKGLCGIFTLITGVVPPETRVPLPALRFDDLPLAVLPLDSSDSDQIIPLDITDLVKAGKFNGIAIRPLHGLCAHFTSREGPLPPSIVLTRGRNTRNPVSWFNGGAAPDPATGKPGDFYVRTVNGVIYRKSGIAWDSAAVLALPPQKPSLKAKRPPRRAVAKKKLAPRKKGKSPPSNHRL